ncbi:VapE domain-containing protein [Alkalinema pantanalense CENA528]|uniref:VapE domain-containing protein n=1 Tax=Alkalinema pantanalense TaxID=1620705 RepID=UPI003D6DFBF8
MQPTLAESVQNAVETRAIIMTENAENRNSSGSFDIRDHIDKLTPAEEKGRYICPVCGGKNFLIHPKKGAYKCFSNHCDSAAIRNAIAPLTPKAKREYRQRKHIPRTKSELDVNALNKAIHIELKVDEIFELVLKGLHTEGQAEVELATWCKEHGADKFAASKLLRERVKELKQAKEDAIERKPRLLREYELIRSKYGDQLRFNFLRKRIELNGQEFPVETAKVEFVIEHGLDLKSNRQDITDVTVKIAKQNTYSPVVDYLDRVAYQYGPSTAILEGIADRYFGTSTPIHQITLVKFLIGAVARAYNPGCKLDTALILQGAQGAGKSSFFRVLASQDWFDDSFSTSSDRDEKIKIHETWIVEWAELETLFKRKDIAQVKAFMSSQIDRVRPAYGKKTEEMRRASVFVGTTNQHDFLTDSTGNRRFWVVPIQKDIDIELLNKERDRIWAAAVASYKREVNWWLTKEEEATMGFLRQAFEYRDTWQDEIATFVNSLERVAIWEILETLFKIEKGQQTKQLQNRVRNCLLSLKWSPIPEPVWHLGKTCRVWVKQ